MKIVHSFWSKPAQKKANFNMADRVAGGWSHPKYNYMSWALSCLRAKEMFGQIDLVTDQHGYNMLIEQLGLPYNQVSLALDDLSDYHPDLWALGKIVAYSIQDEPFIHIDGDVYFWERPSEEILGGALIAQHKETSEHFGFYEKVMTEISQALPYFPKGMLADWRNNGRIVAANAGIMGGHNTDFFKQLRQEVEAFIHNNSAHLDKIVIGGFNMIFEQYLFHLLASQKDIPVKYLFGEVEGYNFLSDFHLVPARCKYIHALGVKKRLDGTGAFIANRLQLEYPEYFDRIIQLFAEDEINEKQNKFFQRSCSLIRDCLPEDVEQGEFSNGEDRKDWCLAQQEKVKGRARTRINDLWSFEKAIWQSSKTSGIATANSQAKAAYLASLNNSEILSHYYRIHPQTKIHSTQWDWRINRIEKDEVGRDLSLNIEAEKEPCQIAITPVDFGDGVEVSYLEDWDILLNEFDEAMRAIDLVALLEEELSSYSREYLEDLVVELVLKMCFRGQLECLDNHDVVSNKILVDDLMA